MLTYRGLTQDVGRVGPVGFDTLNIGKQGALFDQLLNPPGRIETRFA